VFLLGINLISWVSKKHTIVSISFAKVEYISATTTTCHVVWLKRLLKYFRQIEKEPTTIFCDNSSALTLSKKNVVHKK
jgi:hypothetical protein